MKAYIIPTQNIMTTAFYYSLLEKIFKAAGYEVVVDRDFKKYHPDKKHDIIVTGNAYPSVKLWLQGYKKVCTWYQGVVPEERKMQGCTALKVWLHTQVERISLKHSYFCFFVSKAIREHYEEKYKVHISDLNCAIIPCFNEQNTYEGCFAEGVKKSYSFVYSGGMGVWQCFDKTLEVFKIIKKQIPESTLDIFTYQVDKAKAVVDANGIKDVEVRYVPKEEMNEALCSKMFGFVLRDDNVVNNVATPTKFSNYIANGVIPVFSESVRDFAAATKGMKYIISLDSYDIEGIARAIIEGAKMIVEQYSVVEHRKECDSLFVKYYSETEYIRTTSEKLKGLR